jgi:pilus assembly protein Flp/PilA
LRSFIGTETNSLGNEISRRKEVNRVAFRNALVAILSFVRRGEHGQGLAEYALILALIAVVAIVALVYMGTQVSDKLSVIGSTLNSVSNR